MDIEAEDTEDTKEGASPPSEVKAKEAGWVDETAWVADGNDAADWVSAETFNAKGELFSTIHQQKRKIDDLERSIGELKTHQGKIADVERKKVIKELKKAKVVALENEDFTSVVDIDEKMAEVKEIETKQEQASDPAFDPMFTSWKADNKWYSDDMELQEYADFVGNKLSMEGQHYSNVFPEVTKRVKAMFPTKFTNPKRNNSSKVGESNAAAASKAGGSKAKHSWSDLNEDQRNVGNRFSRNGVMTKDEYIKQLEEVGDLD